MIAWVTKHWTLLFFLWAGSATCLGGGLALAGHGVEVPALGARGNSPDAPGIFTVEMLWWDQHPTPDPVTLTWGKGTVNSFQYGWIQHGRTDRGATVQAFRYAILRTPNVHHTGTVNIQGVAYGPAHLDGPSAGAVMAVGFLALFNGDTIQRGIAMTGTLEQEGYIGPVGGLPAKMRAAAREGYHTILIPTGQLTDPRWNLQSLALELNVTVKEVSSIDEAYALMTGRSL